MENSDGLHVAVFPWLAMGHLIPFFHLSKLLAQNGHRVSFLSTPNNILKLPKIPSDLSSLLHLCPITFSHVPSDLPPNAQSSSEVPYSMQQLLKRAFDSLQLPLSSFLRSSSPDWIIYDYAPHWLPRLARELRVSCVFFSLFNAANLAFIGPPSELLIDGGDFRTRAEDFTVVPRWVPFESHVVYRAYEIAKYFEGTSIYEPTTSDTVRFGVAVQGSDVVAVRSSELFEPDWFGLLRELYRKPVVPVGFLPPVIEEDEEIEGDDKWIGVKEWLDRQEVNSVVYVAFGTEADLSRDELSELATGLELAELAFFMVLGKRNSPRSAQTEMELLPDGFVERVRGRGMVYVGWAPQVRILSHDSVGGFLTHCGWNSVIEGLGLGRVLILLPLVNDQGLNARLLTGKGLGIEVPREEPNGSFTSESVAECVRMAMVGVSGESLREKTKEMREMFGNRKTNDQNVEELIRFLKENRRK